MGRTQGRKTFFFNTKLPPFAPSGAWILEWRESLCAVGQNNVSYLVLNQRPELYLLELVLLLELND